jgi:pimeloyl-ACP methyl ester carboxylesterase
VDDDVWTAEVQAAMAGRLGGRYTAITGAAHSPAVENPTETVAALVEFWRSAENHG